MPRPASGSATAHGHDDTAAAGHFEPRAPLDRAEPARQEGHARRQRDDGLRSGRGGGPAPGFAVTATPAIPSADSCHVDGDAPRGDVADDDPASRSASRARRRRRTQTAAGSAITSAALAADASTTPAPCAVRRSAGVGTAVPTSAPFSAGRVEPGPHLREHGGGSAGECCRCARAADRPVARGSVRVPARVGGHELDAGGGDLRLDAAAEGEAVGGERGNRASGARSRASPGAPSETRTSAPRASAVAHRSGGGRRQADNGNVEAVVEAERAGRDEPVDEDRGRPGGHRLAHRRSGPVRPRRAGPHCRRRRCSRGRRSSGRAAPRADRSRTSRRGRATSSESDVRGRGGAAERQLAVEQDAEPGADDDAHRCGLTPQVGRADRERGRRATRAADAAVAGPGRALVPCRDDDERVEAGSARDCACAAARRRTTANGSVTPTTAMRAASSTSPSSSGSTARSSPASSWSVRP